MVGCSMVRRDVGQPEAGEGPVVSVAGWTRGQGGREGMAGGGGWGSGVRDEDWTR